MVQKEQIVIYLQVSQFQYDELLHQTKNKELNFIN